MVRVIDGKVVEFSLPEIGFLNGDLIEDYNMLPYSVLKKEGWLPFEDRFPSNYDPERQTFKFSGYVILPDKVKASYVVIDKPAPTTTIEELSQIVDAMLGGV